MKKSALERAIESFDQLRNKFAAQKTGSTPVVNKKVGGSGKKTQPFPVGTRGDGRTMMSEGAPMSGRPMRAPILRGESNGNIDVLRKNVLDQYNFAPQARARLARVPMGITGRLPQGNYGRYSHYSPGAEDIEISHQAFNSPEKFAPADVMAHEFVHALDGNAHQYKTNYPGNSNNFMSTIGNPEAPDAQYQNIQDFLQNYEDNPYLRDVEAYAQYGATQGPNANLGPAGDFFQGIFNQSSPVMNYSPIYPARPIYNNSLQNIFGQE